jgi:hypothetical protein
MNVMNRQNNLRTQDVQQYLRGYDPGAPIAPEEWAKAEAARFEAGSMLFCLIAASAPGGMTSFTKRDAESGESFRVKELYIVIGQQEGKPLVTNITSTAFEQRFLEVLLKENAVKAILDGKPFQYVSAGPAAPMTEPIKKELEQLAAIYAQGGSRRSLAQEANGPLEPATALLAVLGVRLGAPSGRQGVDIGSVCHMLFGTDGRHDERAKAMVKSCLSPLAGTSNEESAPQPAASIPAPAPAPVLQSPAEAPQTVLPPPVPAALEISPEAAPVGTEYGAQQAEYSDDAFDPEKYAHQVTAAEFSFEPSVEATPAADAGWFSTANPANLEQNQPAAQPPATPESFYNRLSEQIESVGDPDDKPALSSDFFASSMVPPTTVDFSQSPQAAPTDIAGADLFTPDAVNYAPAPQTPPPELPPEISPFAPPPQPAASDSAVLDPFVSDKVSTGEIPVLPPGNELGQSPPDVKASRTNIPAQEMPSPTASLSNLPAQEIQDLNSSFTNLPALGAQELGASFSNLPATETPAASNSFSNLAASETPAASNSFSNLAASETPEASNSFSNLSAAETPAASTSFSNLPAAETPAASTSFSSLPAAETPAASTSFSNLAAAETPAASTSFSNLAAAETPVSSEPYADLAKAISSSLEDIAPIVHGTESGDSSSAALPASSPEVPEYTGQDSDSWHGMKSFDSKSPLRSHLAEPLAGEAPLPSIPEASFAAKDTITTGNPPVIMPDQANMRPTAEPPSRLPVGFQEPKMVMHEMASLMSKLELQVSKASKRLASRAEEIEQRLNKLIESLIEELAQEDKDSEAAILVLSDEIGKDFETAFERLRQRISNLASQGREHVKQLQVESDKKIDEQKQNINDELQNACSQFRTDTEVLIKESKDALNKLVNSNINELETIVNVIGKRLGDTNQEFERTLHERFEKFKDRLADGSVQVVQAIDRNVRTMNDELDSSWERASAKLKESQAEFEQTIEHAVKSSELTVSQLSRTLLVEQFFPKLKERKEIVTAMVAEMTGSFGEQSLTQARGQLMGLEASLGSARQQLQALAEECLGKIDTVGRDQQSILEELFKDASLFLERSTSEVVDQLKKAEEEILVGEAECKKLAETFSLDAEPMLTDDRAKALQKVEELRRQLQEALHKMAEDNCAKLDETAQLAQNQLNTKRNATGLAIRDASQTGLSRIREAIQEAFNAVQSAREKYME